MHINCILPNYYNEKWLVPNVTNLCRKRSGRHKLTFSVVDQRESAVAESEPLRRRLEALGEKGEVEVVFRCVINPEKRGGQSLPRVLAEGMYRDVGGGVRTVDSDITITVDTDTLVYPDRWDDLLTGLYDKSVMLVGINPRRDTAAEGQGRGDFNGVVEWNFMSFRTCFWHERVRSFRPYRVDIGHHFTNAVSNTPGARQILLPALYKPYEDKAATVCGLDGKAFVLHAFYASRRRKDKLPESERSCILTAEQEDELIQSVTGLTLDHAAQ